MKKVLAVLFVLLALGTVAFAKGGFTLRGGFSYDFVNVREASEEGDGDYWRAHAFGAEVGITYDFTDNFLVYYDQTLGFFGKFSIGDAEYDKKDFDKCAFMSSANHVGAAYRLNMKSGIDLSVGAGLAFEYIRIALADYDETEKIYQTFEWGVVSLGLGLYANAGYALSDKMSVSLTVHPDVMFFSSNVISSGESEQITERTTRTESETYSTVGPAVSFKGSACLGITFKF